MGATLGFEGATSHVCHWLWKRPVAVEAKSVAKHRLWIRSQRISRYLRIFKVRDMERLVLVNIQPSQTFHPSKAFTYRSPLRGALHWNSQCPTGGAPSRSWESTRSWGITFDPLHYISGLHSSLMRGLGTIISKFDLGESRWFILNKSHLLVTRPSQNQRNLTLNHHS